VIRWLPGWLHNEPERLRDADLRDVDWIGGSMSVKSGAVNVIE